MVKNPTPKFRWGILQSRLYGQKSLTLNLGEGFYKVFFTVEKPSPKFRWGILQSRLYGQKSLT